MATIAKAFDAHIASTNVDHDVLKYVGIDSDAVYRSRDRRPWTLLRSDRLKHFVEKSAFFGV